MKSVIPSFLMVIILVSILMVGFNVSLGKAVGGVCVEADGSGRIKTESDHALDSYPLSDLPIQDGYQAAEPFGRLVGDIDGDYDVDIFDLVRMAEVYGLAYPDPQYDQLCDFDFDGDIDIFDVVMAAGNYGKSWRSQVQYHCIMWNASRAGETCVFSSYWNMSATSNNENLTAYKLCNNSSGTWNNVTQTFSAGTKSAWLNQTFTMPSTNNITQVYVWVNNSIGWSNYTLHSLLSWVDIPDLSEKVLGETVGGTLVSGRATFFNNATATGGKAAIFVCYANSSDSWHYYVCAFDINARLWTNSYDLGWGGGTDVHWNPNIKETPEGNLIVAAGYAQPWKWQRSTYNASTEGNLTRLVTNWQTKVGMSVHLDYPQLVFVQNKLIVLGREGGAQGGSNFTRMDWNGTNFENYTRIISSSDTFAYPWANVVGNDILVALTPQGSPIGIGFCYSSDVGKTWKFYNGTSFSIPIDDYALKCINDDYHEEVRSQGTPQAFVDEYGRLCLQTTSGNGKKAIVDMFPILGQYSKSYGQSGGTWVRDKMYYSNGTQIRGEILLIGTDPYYGRPSGWGVGKDYAGSIVKIVRDYNETFRFECIYEKIQNTSVWCPQGCYVSSMLNPVEAYDSVIQEFDIGLGYANSGAYQETYSANCLYGTHLTADETIDIIGGSVLVNISTSYSYFWQMAIYNSTWDKIGETASTSQRLGSSNIYRWAYINYSPTSIPIVKGQDYWLCFRIQGGTNKLVYDTGSTNQSFYYSLAGTYYNPLPNELNPNSLSFQSRKYVAVSFLSVLKVYGVGELPPTELAVGWNEISPWAVDVGHTLAEINESVWADGIQLQGITYVNATGTYDYHYDYLYYADVVVTSEGDELWLYCNTTGNWFHDY